MVAAAATGLEPHMKDDGDRAGDGDGGAADDGMRIAVLNIGCRECFFVVHLLWSEIPKKHSARPLESAVFIIQE